MVLPDGQALLTASVNGLLMGGLFAITALGLSLVFGVMRIINLVHGELVIGGSYLSLLLLSRIGIDPLVGMPIVAAGMFALTYPVQRWLLSPMMRKGAEAPLLTTFGLSVIAQNGLTLAFSGDTQSLRAPYANASLHWIGRDIPAIYVISFGVALALSATMHVLLQKTDIGRQIRASSEDPTAAAMLGINVPRIHAHTYALGAACAAVGGVLSGLAFSFNPASGIGHLLSGFAVVVLGGLGSVTGTLLGGLGLGVIEGVGGAIWGDGYRDFIGMIAFLILLAIRPQGLFGRKT